MVDNQHRKIVGYRELSEEEITLINKIKTQGQLVSNLLDQVDRLDGVDKRWANIGATHLQQGFMAVTRAVAQPTSF